MGEGTQNCQVCYPKFIHKLRVTVTLKHTYLSIQGRGIIVVTYTARQSRVKSVFKELQPDDCNACITKSCTTANYYKINYDLIVSLNPDHISNWAALKLPRRLRALGYFHTVYSEYVMDDNGIRYMNEWKQHMTKQRVREANVWLSHIFPNEQNITYRVKHGVFYIDGTL